MQPANEWLDIIINPPKRRKKAPTHKVWRAIGDQMIVTIDWIWAADHRHPLLSALYGNFNCQVLQETLSQESREFIQKLQWGYMNLMTQSMYYFDTGHNQCIILTQDTINVSFWHRTQSMYYFDTGQTRPQPKHLQCQQQMAAQEDGKYLHRKTQSTVT